ncbi:hypothetical protein [Pyxidicoccus trucidator]|uniref:hypothetical protein n=1 Tax=Pyxidicoccus trucidator TaxID=2709662 RepID=UPI0013DBA2DA|nr:hypothetical protein [Pyxidicoccus trucidator]
MKKVLIGVGIGCGVILLLGIGAVVAGGFLFKKTFGGTLEAGQKMSAQEEQLTKLNQEHTFQAPPQGEVLALEPKRLETYFAVRESALPAFKALEQKAEAFEQEHGGEEGKKNPSFSAAMDATNLMMSMMVDVRAAYIEGLKQHDMSPAEFQTITGTVYASLMAEGLDQAREGMKQGRAALEKQLEEMDTKLEGDALSDEERTQLEEAQGQLQAAIDAMDQGAGQAGEPLSEEGRKVTAANVALLKKYEDRVQLMANAAFDSFVLGGASTDFAGGANAQEAE